LLFNGDPAEPFFRSETQINLNVPASATPGQPLRLHAGDAEITLDIAPAAPGVYTADGSGSGRAAATIADGLVSLAVTGLGVASDVSVELAGAPMEVVSVSSGEILFRLPAAAFAFGEVPVVVKAAGRQSQSFALLPLEMGERPASISALDNGILKVGKSMRLGGSITWLSRSGSTENIINNYDYGRQVQLSFYSGPVPFLNPHPSWPQIGWNPIGAGDVYKNPSRLIALYNDGTVLYARAIPLHWPLNNVACECTFETWLRLDGNTAHIQAKMRNNRSDQTFYPARGQELPAVYVTGKYYRLFTYNGDAPFTSAPLREIRHAGPPFTTWNPTENWAAYVDDNNFGLAVYNPGIYRFGGGFAGRPGSGGEFDNPTGYISPIISEIIDHNIEYGYQFRLILGTLEEIRAAVYRLHPPSPNIPVYIFDKDRQHFTYQNVRDTGWPIDGRLHLVMDRADPHMTGPPTFFRAADVPKLYIRAAISSANSNAEVFFGLPNVGIRAGQSVRFNVIPDGQPRTYEIDLSSNPLYQGIIEQLRLDPVATASPGDWAEIYHISARPVE
jgi:hypothetical protein